MTKAAFVGDAEVQALARWVADRFAAETGWSHSWRDRRTEATWECRGLADAARQYRWNKKNWQRAKVELDSYRQMLRAAVEMGKTAAAIEASSEILKRGRERTGFSGPRSA